MGCDIHFVLERREKGKDNWLGVFSTSAPSPARAISHNTDCHDYGVLLEQRNYRFFAALAGVRGRGPEPNGLPEDMSELAHELVDGWDTDGHSHGHCSAFEFISTWDLAANEGRLTAEATKKRLAGSHYASNTLYAVLGIYSDEFEDFRVVYLFDN